jgi:hypothetical protein
LLTLWQAIILAVFIAGAACSASISVTRTQKRPEPVGAFFIHQQKLSAV